MRYTEDQLKDMAKPASDSEEQRMDNATRMVKDALANNGVINSWNYEVYAQGSYANVSRATAFEAEISSPVADHEKLSPTPSALRETRRSSVS